MSDHSPFSHPLLFLDLDEQQQQQPVRKAGAAAALARHDSGTALVARLEQVLGDGTNILPFTPSSLPRRTSSAIKTRAAVAPASALHTSTPRHYAPPPSFGDLTLSSSSPGSCAEDNCSTRRPTRPKQPLPTANIPRIREPTILHDSTADDTLLAAARRPSDPPTLLMERASDSIMRKYLGDTFISSSLPLSR
ncbi:hypothetical protein RI367_000547 [Sorochytrium milnesiophthora]